MYKKFRVELSESERKELEGIVKSSKTGLEKLRRARILLKSDENGLGWKDELIAQAESCRVTTVHNVRKKFVQEGLNAALDRKARTVPGRKKLLNGEQEAQLIAMRLGEPPEGFGSWSLRLLADQVVERELVESISHETIRKTLKKTE